MPNAEPRSDYEKKRRFDATPEPPAVFSGDVDPATAPVGDRFVIQQHHATRLHHDVRLEMLNGELPVLVSWAVPKGLPRRKGERALAVKTEDHPIEYAEFTGTIPPGEYGGGVVRRFDAGTYDMVDRRPGRLTVQFHGGRIKGRFHLVRTEDDGGKEQWLAIMSEPGPGPSDPLPPLDPMLATLAPEPFDDEAWGFEPKWDGIRALAVVDDQTRLWSRNGNDVTAGYPDLAKVHDQIVAVDAVVDGEIVAMDDGVPSFQLLQQRMHVRAPGELEKLVRRIPVSYIAFDLLYLDGTSLLDRPFGQRRELLEEVLVPSNAVQLSPMVVGEGRALYEAVAAQRLEGIVAKRLSSTYRPGKRSQSWRKVKTTMDVDVVVAGWRHGEGRRAGTLGSLVVGLYDEGVLRYVGNVGTGFDQRSLAEVTARLEEVAAPDSPFSREERRRVPALRQTTWVEPVLVATVEYRQVTDANKLRAPSFKGLRDDKAPADCTLDQLTGAAGDDA